MRISARRVLGNLRRWFPRKNALCTLFLLSGELQARMLYQPDLNRKIGDIAVKDSRDETSQLSEYISKAESWALLVPVFSTCVDICPLVIAKVRSAVSEFSKRNPGKTLSVIVFDFNPKDRTLDLEDFRKKLDYPKEWVSLRPAGSALEFFKRLDYPIMEAKDGFLHKAIVFAVTKNGTLIAMAGSDLLNGADLEELEAFARRYLDHPRITEIWYDISHPQNLAVLSFISLFILIGFILVRARDQGLSPYGSQTTKESSHLEI